MNIQYTAICCEFVGVLSIDRDPVSDADTELVRKQLLYYTFLTAARINSLSEPQSVDLFRH